MAFVPPHVAPKGGIGPGSRARVPAAIEGELCDPPPHPLAGPLSSPPVDLCGVRRDFAGEPTRIEPSARRLSAEITKLDPERAAGRVCACLEPCTSQACC